MFISFEGGEGAGKSLQIAALQAALSARGLDVVRTREPGGSPAAEQLRDLLVSGGAERWSPMSELLLFAAARVEHIRQTIAPALARGAVVLCDRFVDSTIAYQGAGKGLDQDLVASLHETTTGGLWPDLTLVLDVPPEIGLARSLKRLADAGSGEDRFEGLDIGFHERVRGCLLARAAADPGRHAVIDATRPPDEVGRDVLAAVDARLR